ncbi:MAG: hypothetical protein KAG62_19490 [Caulobacter sp.]|nr:hypothetical protein [Caulobacter sp.]
MLIFALFVALSGQATQDGTVDAVTVEASRKVLQKTLPDQQIILQLNALLKAEPDRVVCVKKARGGSIIPETVCGTLRQWYDQEKARNTANVMAEIKGEASGHPPTSDPPHELVQMIKQRLKDPEARALAAERAKQRIEAKAQTSQP